MGVGRRRGREREERKEKKEKERKRLGESNPRHFAGDCRSDPVPWGPSGGVHTERGVVKVAKQFDESGRELAEHGTRGSTAPISDKDASMCYLSEKVG